MGHFYADWTGGRIIDTEPCTVGVRFRIYSGFYCFACWYVEREIKSSAMGSSSICSGSGGTLVAREMVHLAGWDSRQRSWGNDRCKITYLRLLRSSAWHSSLMLPGQVVSG